MKFKTNKKIEYLRDFAVNYGLSLKQAIHLFDGDEVEITNEVVAEGLSKCEFIDVVKSAKPKVKKKSKDSEVK